MRICCSSRCFYWGLRREKCVSLTPSACMHGNSLDLQLLLQHVGRGNRVRIGVEVSLEIASKPRWPYPLWVWTKCIIQWWIPGHVFPASTCAPRNLLRVKWPPCGNFLCLLGNHKTREHKHRFIVSWMWKGAKYGAGGFRMECLGLCNAALDNVFHLQPLLAALWLGRRQLWTQWRETLVGVKKGRVLKFQFGKQLHWYDIRLLPDAFLLLPSIPVNVRLLSTHSESDVLISAQLNCVDSGGWMRGHENY